MLCRCLKSIRLRPWKEVCNALTNVFKTLVRAPKIIYPNSLSIDPVAQVCPWLLIGNVKYVAFDVKVKVLTKLKTRLTMLSFVMRGLVP